MRSRRPARSLTRRVVLTICCALGLIWLGLIALEVVQTRLLEPENPSLPQSATGLREALAGIEDPQLATSIIQAIHRMGVSQLRQAHIDVQTVMQVRDSRDGRILFHSRPDLQLDNLPTGYSRRTLAGTLYYIYFQREGRWEIAVGQASVPTAWLLKQVGGDITVDVLIAFPFVLVPVWLAVWLGLRPLRRLANSIGKRDPDDLTPVQVTQPHAELSMLADAFNLQLAKVAQLIARERAFVQDAAHELRTPMAVIAINAHAVADAQTAEDRVAAEARLHSGLSRTSHLIEQLLVLARLDVGRQSEMELRDVVSLVQETIAAVAPTALAIGIDLSLEAPEFLQRYVEIRALNSIVGNLVDNALRYGQSGGHIVVTVAASESDGWILSVADDGPGIPPAERERVFERFYRGDHEEVQGTGLGLAITRAAAARLGATVHITDGLDGRGCAFIVQFSTTAT